MNRHAKRARNVVLATLDWTLKVLDAIAAPRPEARETDKQAAYIAHLCEDRGISRPDAISAALGIDKPNLTTTEALRVSTWLVNTRSTPRPDTPHPRNQP